MSKKLDGTKTSANLAEAFAGESQAYTMYGFFAAVARKEGHHGIARIFEETAANERYHAKMWFKHMGHLNGTLENLKKAASGENYEWTKMYADMSKEAISEGFDKIAKEMKLVANIENDHEKRYLEFAKHLENGTLYKRDKEIWWECLNCGHHHHGKSAPEMCETCDHPQGWFIEDTTRRK